MGTKPSKIAARVHTVQISCAKVFLAYVCCDYGISEILVQGLMFMFLLCAPVRSLE